LVIGAFVALAGCGTTNVVSGESTLSGKDLQMAVNLYGPWEGKMDIDGVSTYVWRRHYTASDTKQDFYCELRVQMGFRTTISSSVMQGYPAACNLFGITYKSELK
jgi:hypothetical protein